MILSNAIVGSIFYELRYWIGVSALLVCFYCVSHSSGLRHVETDKKDKAKDEPKPKKEMKKYTPKRIPTLTVTQQQLANKKAEVRPADRFSVFFFFSPNY